MTPRTTLTGRLRAARTMHAAALPWVAACLLELAAACLVAGELSSGHGTLDLAIGLACLLAGGAVMMTLILHGKALASGYRQVTAEECARLRTGSLTHLSVSPCTDEALRIDTCRLGARMPDREHPWQVLPWRWPRAVYLWAELPDADTRAVNVPGAAKAIHLYVDGTDLPARRTSRRRPSVAPSPIERGRLSGRGR